MFVDVYSSFAVSQACGACGFLQCIVQKSQIFTLETGRLPEGERSSEKKKNLEKASLRLGWWLRLISCFSQPRRNLLEKGEFGSDPKCAGYTRSHNGSSSLPSPPPPQDSSLLPPPTEMPDKLQNNLDYRCGSNMFVSIIYLSFLA